MSSHLRFQAKSILILCVCIAIGLGISLISTRAYANANEAQSNNDVNQVNRAGVTMSIDSSSFGQDSTDVIVCFDLPSTGDWFPDGVLLDGATTIQPLKIVLVNWRDPQTLEGEHRCFQFTFASKINPTARIKVNEIKTSIPETLTQADCDRALSKIKQQTPDFTFSCTIDKHGVAFNFSELPQGMTDAQVGNLIEDALTSTVEGPWELPVIR